MITSIRNQLNLEDLRDNLKRNEFRIKRPKHRRSKVKPIKDKDKKGTEPVQVIWKSQRASIMGLIAYSVGLTNVWKFPLLISENGGLGCLLIPYIMGIFGCGIPMTKLEISLGQYSARGPLTIWGLCPVLKGLGVASIILLILSTAYYGVMTAFILHYFVSSFTFNLPWNNCSKPWANDHCVTVDKNYTQMTQCVLINESRCVNTTWEISTKQYFERYINRAGVQYYGWERINNVVLNYIIITQLFVFICNCNGINSIQKVIKFFIIYPIVALSFLLLITFFNKGFVRGFMLFIGGDFSFLLKVKTWIVVLHLIVYSLGLGLGGIIVLGSTSFFRNSCHKNAIRVNLFDFGSSVLISFVMFNVFGTFSYHTHIPIAIVNEWKLCLVFMKMSLSVSEMYSPSICSMLYYSMLYIMGLRSQIMMQFAIYQSFHFIFPYKIVYNVLWSGVVTLSIFIFCILLTTQLGFDLMTVTASIVLGPAPSMIICLQAIAVFWMYGSTRYLEDMKFMLGFELSKYWETCWDAAPLTFLLHFLLDVTYESWEKNDDTIWHKILYWSSSIILGAALIISGIAETIRRKVKQIPLVTLVIPDPDWFPIDEDIKRSRRIYRSNALTDEYMYRQNIMLPLADLYQRKGCEMPVPVPAGSQDIIQN